MEMLPDLCSRWAAHKLAGGPFGDAGCLRRGYFWNNEADVSSPLGGFGEVGTAGP